MTESRWNPEKPLVITAICIIGIINAIQMINLVLSPMSKQAGRFIPSILLCPWPSAWPVSADYGC